jgi:hypothetical protein
MDASSALFAPVRPLDEDIVVQLANELHGISPLPIASYGECLNIARALLDVGCPSLMSLVELPEEPIKSVEDLKSHLQNLKYPLGKLQLCRILQWIQQQQQAPASVTDVGSKRAHPELPQRAHATAALAAPLMQVQTVRDAHAALSPLPADLLAPVTAFEAAGKFMEIVCVCPGLLFVFGIIWLGHRGNMLSGVATLRRRWRTSGALLH